MNVKLVSYSQPSEEYKAEGLNDAQELIAFCAFVKQKTALEIYVFSGYYLHELYDLFPDKLFLKFMKPEPVHGVHNAANACKTRGPAPDNARF